MRGLRSQGASSESLEFAGYFAVAVLQKLADMRGLRPPSPAPAVLSTDPASGSEWQARYRTATTTIENPILYSSANEYTVTASQRIRTTSDDRKELFNKLVDVVWRPSQDRFGVSGDQPAMSGDFDEKTLDSRRWPMSHSGNPTSVISRRSASRLLSHRHRCEAPASGGRRELSETLLA